MGDKPSKLEDEADETEDVEVEYGSELTKEVSLLKDFARNRSNSEEADIFQDDKVFDFKRKHNTEGQTEENEGITNNEPYLMARKKTLARYNYLFDNELETPDKESGSDGRPKTALLHAVDEGIKQRSGGGNGKEKEKRRVTRAMTLKKAFFEKDDKISGSNEEPDRWIDRVKEDEIEDKNLPQESELLYENMENAIQENISRINSMKKDRKMDPKSNKEIEHVRLLRNKLLETQKHLLSKQKEDANSVIKAMKKQIKALKKSIKAKNKEGYKPDEGDINGENRNKGKKKKKRKKKAKRHSVQNPERQEKEYITQVNYLKAELTALSHALKALMLERRFPRAMKWKMRVDGGEGLYVGVRDMEIEKLTAKYHISTGHETGVIKMKVTDIDAIIGVLQFVITGHSALAKLLGGVLTPTINRLDLRAKGEWELCLRWKGSKWVEDKKNSKFRLDIQKQVSGITSIQLPSAFINLLSVTIFPRLISAAIREVLPRELNTFNYDEFLNSSIPFLAKKGNKIHVDGDICVEGEMSPNVWRAPLYSPTDSSIAARKALLIQNKDEAFALDFILRGPCAIQAGFYDRAITLERLYKWRLRYAVYDVCQLEPLLDAIQESVSMPSTNTIKLPKGWLSQILHRVEELSNKPMRFDINVSTFRTDVDLIEVARNAMQVYLTNLIDQKFDKSQSEKARTALETEITSTKIKTIQTLKFLHDITKLLNNRLSVNCNVLLDGKVGIFLTSLEDIAAELALVNVKPQKFIIPKQSDDIPIWLAASNDVDTGEYTVSIYGEEPSRELETVEISRGKADITVRDVNLSLFPTNVQQPGTVSLTAGCIRGTSGFGILDDVITAALIGGDNDKDKLLNDHKNKISDELRDKKIQALIDQSTAIIARNWRDFNVGNVSIVNNSNASEANIAVSDYSSLPDILTNESNKLFAICNGLVLEFVKDRNTSAADDGTVRLIADYSDINSTKDHRIKFSIRQEIGKVFEHII